MLTLVQFMQQNLGQEVGNLLTLVFGLGSIEERMKGALIIASYAEIRGFDRITYRSLSLKDEVDLLCAMYTAIENEYTRYRVYGSLWLLSRENKP